MVSFSFLGASLGPLASRNQQAAEEPGETANEQPSETRHGA
jgi:hypothetical protein